MPVNQRAASISGHEVDWRTCRDVYAGDAAVKAGGTTYLPQLVGQSTAQYAAYRDRAAFFNAYARTADSLRGLVFRNDVRHAVPRDLEPMLEDVTLNGESLRAFAERGLDELLHVGWGGLFVDHTRAPEAGGPRTMAEFRRSEQRPFVRWYRAEDVLEVRFEAFGMRRRMIRVRLRETVVEPDPQDEFGEIAVEQWRVLDVSEGVYRQRVFREREGQVAPVVIDEFTPARNGQPLDHIPFYPISARGFAAIPTKPPLLDLATTNLSHWRTVVDLENAAHATGIPTPMIASEAVSETFDIELGTHKGYVFGGQGANGTKWGFLSYGGEGLAPLKEWLATKEYQMAIQGARMLLPEKLQAEAAETVRMRRHGETSVLAAMAISLSEALTWAVSEMRDWTIGAGEVEIEINSDFDPTILDPAMLRELRDTWKIGGISMEMWLEQLKRGEIVPPEMSVEAFEEQRVQGVNDPVTLSQILGNLGQGGLIDPGQVDLRVLEGRLGLPEGLLGAPSPLVTEEPEPGFEAEAAE